MGNSQDLYGDFTRLLYHHRNDVLEFEIIPTQLQPADGHSSIIHEDCSIALPKRTLVQIFLEARARFWKFKPVIAFFPARSSKVEAQYALSEALAASKVLLIYDPEYLSAAGLRKSVFWKIAHDKLPSDETLQDLLQQEAKFVEGLVTSPLHRHTKSPTLWFHRRWILSTFGPISLTLDLSRELALITKAGERHPKNYYSWSYGRHLLQRHADGDFLAYCVTQVGQWTLRNPSDCSGWSFLLHCLEIQSRQGSVVAPVTAEAIFGQVCQYAIRCGLFGEALWWFIRNLLASSACMSESSRNEGRVLLQSYIENLRSAAQGRARIQNALDWVASNWKAG